MSVFPDIPYPPSDIYKDMAERIREGDCVNTGIEYGHNKLTVSDVERLAKSGVKVDIKDIRDQIRADYPQAIVAPPAPFDRFSVPQLTEPFFERYGRQYTLMNNAANSDNRRYEGSYRAFPFHLSAYVQADKVYLFICFTNRSDLPPMILEDDRKMYPSDALMAKVLLVLGTKGDGSSDK